MPNRTPLSIRRKLPLLIGSLLLVIGLASSLTAYLTVRKATLSASRARLAVVTTQVGDMLGASAVRLFGILDTLRARRVFTAVLARPGGRDSTAAHTLLDSLSQHMGQTMATEMWNADGTRLVSGGKPLPPLARALVRSETTGLPAGSTRVSPFRVDDGHIDYDVVASIADGAHVSGYLVLRRRVLGSAGTQGELRRLVGSGATIYVGNADGSVWTDLAGVAPPPPVTGPAPKGGIEEYTRPGKGRVYAASRPVAGTPWVVRFEFPQAVALRAPHQVAVWLGLITLLVVGVGSVAGWMLTRTITGPLSELAGAATAIAGGQASQRVTVQRQDELGALATAFNQMADHVKQAHTRLEEQVAQRTAALETVNRELEAFSYSVSHDLRAPLRSIDGFSQALLEDYEDQLDEEGRTYLRRVRAASQRMGHLIDDLLALARVTRTRIEQERVDLTALATEIGAELREHAQERQVALTVTPGLAAQGDPRLLRVALSNLLGNAWKFTGQREDARVEFGLAQIDGTPTLFVRDNGVGFDMQYADKLFGPFQRLHRAEDFEGTGIGLATVQRIIHRHGGRIWAESEPGQGATMWFTLPTATIQTERTA